ncbi:50S ribosomal protein L19 [Spirochaeta thermophila]|uniref:Large ribosomal subunit protein bL19 n=1 Tax=Winmispira thermophila (strain ATCC 49972 / DSM 6192 / RI 19.B1) TaxID=665571 RepID=E0RSL5_WINT6|nr:50S ribosomal protein L19 [Spirochaeta thermophila]ADN02002.1 50S ribosomal protein L19 [Spirochaeta thermophila DSM 6192]
MNELQAIEARQMVDDRDNFNVGDTVRVHFRIDEGQNERIQVFEGIVIAKKHGGLRETFIVRKISYGVGVERILPLHSPRIQKIEVVRRGKVRRAKLYFLRDRIGKRATRVKEKLPSKK